MKYYYNSKYQGSGKAYFSSNGWVNEEKPVKVLKSPISIGQIVAWVITLIAIGKFLLVILS